jgi:hypothetical protein
VIPKWGPGSKQNYSNKVISPLVEWVLGSLADSCPKHLLDSLLHSLLKEEEEEEEEGGEEEGGGRKGRKQETAAYLLLIAPDS